MCTIMCVYVRADFASAKAQSFHAHFWVYQPPQRQSIPKMESHEICSGYGLSAETRDPV